MYLFNSRPQSPERSSEGGAFSESAGQAVPPQAVLLPHSVHSGTQTKAAAWTDDSWQEQEAAATAAARGPGPQHLPGRGAEATPQADAHPAAGVGRRTPRQRRLRLPHLRLHPAHELRLPRVAGRILRGYRGGMPGQ